MPASISIITLGVSDLERSIAFYTRIGFKRVTYESTAIAFFQAGGPKLALFPLKDLAHDVGQGEISRGFSGVTLAQNLPTSQAVDKLLRLATSSGGELIKDACPVSWGGYSGYFADPDGHLWEVACGSVAYQDELNSKLE